MGYVPRGCGPLGAAIWVTSKTVLLFQFPNQLSRHGRKTKIKMLALIVKNKSDLQQNGLPKTRQLSIRGRKLSGPGQDYGPNSGSSPPCGGQTEAPDLKAAKFKARGRGQLPWHEPFPSDPPTRFISTALGVSEGEREPFSKAEPAPHTKTGVCFI